jgi:hypothetical protein
VVYYLRSEGVINLDVIANTQDDVPVAARVNYLDTQTVLSDIGKEPEHWFCDQNVIFSENYRGISL